MTVKYLSTGSIVLLAFAVTCTTAAPTYYTYTGSVTGTWNNTGHDYGITVGDPWTAHVAIDTGRLGSVTRYDGQVFEYTGYFYASWLGGTRLTPDPSRNPYVFWTFNCGRFTFGPSFPDYRDMDLGSSSEYLRIDEYAGNMEYRLTYEDLDLTDSLGPPSDGVQIRITSIESSSPLDPATVPAPSALLLAACGLVSLGGKRRS